METQEKQMSAEESITLIYEMINSTKQNLKKDGFIFLFWGYLVLTAALLQFGLIQLSYGEHSGVVWAILMPLGGIVSAIRGYRKSKKENVKTHLDAVMSYLWIGFGISMFVLFFVMVRYGYPLALLPMIMMLYGIGTFVSGGILKFRPLIFGGISCWGIAIASTFFTVEIQLLFISLSLITGYIIPGHMLRASADNN